LSISVKIRSGEKLIKYFEKNFDNFTPTQKVLANYLTTNIDEAVFLTADEISDKINTVPSTITRFAKEIGLSGFPEMKNKLREILVNKVNSIDQFKGKYERAKLLKINSTNDAIHSSFSYDLSNLEKLSMTKNEANIKKLAHVLLSARRKYIVSSRTSYALGHFFFYELKKIISDVFFQSNFDGGMFDALKELDSNDIVIAISFPRYVKTTYDFTIMAKKRGSKIISITDSRLSPLYALSEFSFLCPCESPSYSQSYVASFALVNAILCYLFYCNYDLSIKNLEKEELIINKLENMHKKLK